MTFTVYAFTNNKARLLQKKATFSNDETAAELIASFWKNEGFIVTFETEE
tara:strand:+ start:8568 stop:8717 length:150 start_codon:yes stop_codon:yes gene_type:complete